MALTSKIGLGSVQFGLPYGISNTSGQTSDTEVSKIMEVAFQYGITTIDTASSYGSSESVIGKQKKNSFDIVSKFMPSSTAGGIKKQIENSLEALNVSQLYGYLAHRPLELISNKKDWEEIQEFKAAGKINKIGFSLNAPNEYHQLLEVGIIPDIVQVPFNYFDTRFKEILTQLKQQGCETHTRSTFLQGLFFIEKKKLSDFFKPLIPELDYLQTTCKNNLSSSLLKYALQQPFIDKVILGVENASQLEENINGLAVSPELEPLTAQFPEQLLMPMHWPKK